uniref:Uncharacterized protein n=1 Tax=Anopheles minimus TaxID=112268 RepID=A0A182VVH6_9DIPT
MAASRLILADKVSLMLANYSTVSAKATQQLHHEAVQKTSVNDKAQAATENGTVSSQQTATKKAHPVDTVTARPPITDARSKRSKSPPRSCSTGKGPEMANGANEAAVNGGSGGGGGVVNGAGAATIRGSGPNGELTLKDVPVSGISFQEIFKPDHEGPPTTQVIIYKPKSGKGQPTAKVIVTKQQGSPLRQQHLPAQQHLMREQDRLDSPHQLEPEPNHASHQHVQHGPVARFICLGSNQTTGDTLTRLRTMMLGQTGASGTWTVHENSSQYMDPDAARQVGQQLVGPTYTYTGSALFPRSATATPQHYPTPTTTTDNVYEAGEQQMLQGLRPSYSGTILDLSTRANARAHALTAERMPQQQSEMLPRLPSGWSEQMQPIGVPQHSYPIRGTIEWTRRAQGLSLSSSSPALGPAVSSTAFNVPIQHAATVGRTNQQNELYQQAVQRSASHLSDFWAEAMVNRTSDQPHRSWDYARIMAPIQTHRGQIEEGRMPTATVTRAGIVPSGVVADSYRTSVPSVWEAEGRISSSLSNVPAALVTLPTPTVQSAPVPSNHSIESVPINDYTSSSASSLEHEAPADKPQSSVGSANARIQQMFTIPLSTNNMTVTVSLLSPNMAPLPPSRDPPRPTPAEFALPTPLQQGAQQDAGPFPTALSERRLQPRNDHQTVSYPEPSASGISSYRQAMVAPPSAGVSEHHQAPSPMTLEKTIVTSSTPREEVREQAVAVQQPHVQLSKPEVPPLPTRALLPNQGDTLWTPEQHAQLDREVVTVCTKRELPAAPPSTPVVQEGAQPVASLPTAPRTLDLEGDVVGVELPQQVLPSASTEPTTASHASSGSSFCCGARNHSIASIIGPSRSHSIASAPLPAERPVQPNRTIKLTQSATHIMFTTPQQHQNSEHTAATLWDSSYHYTDQASQTLNTEPTKQSVGDTSHLYQFPYPYNAEYLEDTDSDDESPSYDATTRPPYNIDEARAQEVQMQDENGDDEEEDYDEYDEEEDEEEEKVKEEYDEAVEVQVKEEVVGCVKRPMDDTKHDVTASSAEFGDCKPSTSGAREWKLQRQNSNLKMHFYRDSNVYKIKSEAGGEVLTEDEEEEEEEDDNSEDVRAQEQQREHTLCPGQPIALEPAGTHDSHHQYPMYDARKDLDLSSQSSNASSRSSSSSSNETTATVPADDCRLVGQERGYESPEEQCTPNDIEVETKKRRTE